MTKREQEDRYIDKINAELDRQCDEAMLKDRTNESPPQKEFLDNEFQKLFEFLDNEFQKIFGPRK